MDWDDQVAANGGAWNEGAWWEAPGGEESRGGGQGKGGKWRRKPGTVAFLKNQDRAKNHRNMLTHMAKAKGKGKAKGRTHAAQAGGITCLECGVCGAQAQ